MAATSFLLCMALALLEFGGFSPSAGWDDPAARLELRQQENKVKLKLRSCDFNSSHDNSQGAFQQERAWLWRKQGTPSFGMTGQLGIYH